jgi:cytochrome b561/polyisoprenoid-binding protein YceI
MTRSAARYGAEAIAAHWLLALLIAGNFAFGLYFIDLPFSPQKLKYFSWHKWAGVIVLPLAAGLLASRALRGDVPLPPHMPRWEKQLSRFTHILLYFFFFASPLSGWLYSSATGFQTVLFGVLPIPDAIGKDPQVAEALKALHRWINYVLGAVVAVHVAAAIKHQLVDRDDVLARMVPFLKLFLVFSLAATLSLSPAFAQAPQKIDAAKSSIRFVSKQMGVPVEGRFRRFDASVAFDPKKPEGTKAQFEVDLASIDLGSEEGETEVKRPLWFDTAKFPRAKFTLASLKPAGAGKYEASGALTIKGITQSIAVPVSFADAGGARTVEGQFTMKRLQFHIGEGHWSDTETVADEVLVRFRFVLPSR